MTYPCRDLTLPVETRLVKLFKGFKRITLQPEESCGVNFTVRREQRQYLNEAMRLVVEPGQFELMVGGSSQSLQKIVLTVIM